MHHGRGHKGQRVGSQGKGVALSDNDSPVGVILAEEVPHHGERLGGRNDGGIRIGAHELGDIRRVIRLHVLYDQIIRLPAAKHTSKVVQPFMGEVSVHRVHDGDLFVKDHIGIVCHSVGNHILTLKEVNLMIIDTDITNVICNFHLFTPSV